MQHSHDAAVLVGRFQPFSNGHLALLRRALALAPLCVVALTWSRRARTPRNPLSWRERAEMIRLALPEAERGRLAFVPVREPFDDERRAALVREGVMRCLAEHACPEQAKVAFVGPQDDAAGHDFPGWHRVPVERVPGVASRRLRDALFQGEGQPEATLAALVEQAPRSTLDFLRAWTALPCFAELAQEWRMLRRYREEWAGSPYPPIFVTVDAVVHCADQVLLVQRGHAPGKGLLAAPGGFIDPKESTWESAVRELREETRLSLPDELLRQSLKARGVFDHPLRSERGRTITHAHFFDLGDCPLPGVQGSDDAAEALWVPIGELGSLEDRFLDDHFWILRQFLDLPMPEGG